MIASVVNRALHESETAIGIDGTAFSVPKYTRRRRGASNGREITAGSERVPLRREMREGFGLRDGICESDGPRSAFLV